jgi:hypothetical protein
MVLSSSRMTGDRSPSPALETPFRDAPGPEASPDSASDCQNTGDTTCGEVGDSVCESMHFLVLGNPTRFCRNARPLYTGLWTLGLGR